MVRSHRGRLGAGCLLLAAAAVASAAAPDGNYKFTLLVEGEEATPWIIRFENKDGKLTGEVAASQPRFAAGRFTDVTFKNDVLRFVFELKGKQKAGFEGKVSVDGKMVRGVFMQGDHVLPAQLQSTVMTAFNPLDVYLDMLAQADSTPSQVFHAAQVLLSHAGKNKAKVEDVRTWANRASKAAEPFGLLWQREMALRIGEILSQSEEYVPVALQYIRQAERMLQPGDKVAVQERTLSLLAGALTKAGKADEAKDIIARVEKLEAVAPTKFPGRKTGDRVAVVELFTGAECPPCVGADLAFDALGKTFKPSEVVLLQYHLHIPGPDPLTNSDTVARKRYYGNDIEGAPSIFFNGKVQDFGGGTFGDAQELYQMYVEGLTPLVEKPARVKLKVSALLQGTRIAITAEASDLDDPGDKMRLRLALVEKEVVYRGGNRVPRHHHVVRALPGGADGIPLKEKSGKQTVTVDLDNLRKQLNAYLDEAAKDLQFPRKDRPLELKDLLVVAFVQNDVTKEILQAAQTAVVPAKP
jgi:hypothetical protein